MLTEEERTAAGELLASFGSVAMKRMIDEGATTTFGNEIGQLAMENVFARLWLRPGLDRRSRSLLTLGILIALQAHAELKVHVLIALKNGLSVEAVA